MTASPRQGVYLSHIERTAKEPRDDGLHTVVLTQIDQVNDRIRLLQLSIPGRCGIKFLPGQWLDVHVPGIPKPGGFTITSPPSLSSASAQSPYIELAIQSSPTNPPAAWLWRPSSEILNTELQVRVGGSFVWPPPSGTPELGKNGKGSTIGIRRVVFIAGGVGINPLMAILSHLTQLPEAGFEVVFVYSFRLENGKDAAEVLFLQRLRRIFEEGKVRGRLHLFVTSGGEDGHGNGFKGEGVTIRKRRVGKEDVLEMLGPLEERRETVCYICGVPTMTDEFVQVAQEAEGMDLQRVLFERWW